MNISDLTSILPLPEHVLNFTQDEDTQFQYQSHPIHNHPLTAQDYPHDQLPPLADEVSLEYQQFPLPQQHHVSESDLLKSPLIANSIVVDLQSSPEDSDESSEEKDN
jgi:hypothetical protein